MELEEILRIFGEKWDKIVAASSSKGIPNAFYPVVIPDAESYRYVDGDLPSTKIALVRLVRAKIINPTPLQFTGVLISQSEDQNLGEGTSISTVTYVRKGEIYRVQCLKEVFEDFSAERYTMISEPKKIKPEEFIPELKLDLQKTYMDISSFL
mgnify:FL=1